MKLSPIFPANIKPCADRPGVYLCRLNLGWFYCWWDGIKFSDLYLSSQEANKQRMEVGECFHQDVAWRGVATKDGA